jgi:hypothetical protein
LPAPTVTEPGAGPAAGGGGGALPLPPPSGALPANLAAPSNRPYEALSTPLSQPIPVATEPTQQQIQLWQAWSRDPSRPALQEFARIALDRLAQ